MVTFKRFLKEPTEFYVSYEFEDFSSSRKVALARCADYVEYLVRNHEVLKAEPFEYESPCGRYQIIAEVVDDGGVEYYGIRKSLVWSFV